MKKKNPFETKGPITELDIAKVLGTKKEYEYELLKGSLKEAYDEFLQNVKKGKSTERFDFNKQFNFPVDYYKAYFLLKLLNEKIRLTNFVNKSDDLKALTVFCDEHHIEILGYDVIKFTEPEDFDDPPKMEYLGNISKPTTVVNNQWALSDIHIKAVKAMNNVLYPILRISHETLRFANSYDQTQLKLINEFDVSMTDEPLQEIMLGSLLSTDGCCLNCGHEDFIFDGIDQSCNACGCMTILQKNTYFTINEGIRKEVREFVINLTGKDIH